MTSLDKMERLIAIQKAGHYARITTAEGESFLCKLQNPAEDEEDWAYDVITIGKVPRHYTLECNFIEYIEEAIPAQEAAR